MRTVSYNVSSTIPVPMERVFELLTDPTSMPKWIPSCRSADAMPPIQKGSIIRMQFDEREATVEVVEVKPYSLLAWVEREPRRHWRTVFRLAFAGGSTTISVTQQWMPPSFMTWLRARFFPKRNVAARLDRLMRNVRQALSK
jgi:uncharacterized protein YndB with AHSA1/START domain